MISKKFINLFLNNKQKILENNLSINKEFSSLNSIEKFGIFLGFFLSFILYFVSFFLYKKIFFYLMNLY